MASARVSTAVSLNVPSNEPPKPGQHRRRASFSSGLSQYVEAFDLVFENQRRNNGEFTTNLLFQDPAPWSDELGATVGQGLESVNLPSGWEAMGTWIWDPEAIQQKISNESDGWQYAKAFAGSKWQPNPDDTTNVRRRPWVRKRRKKRENLRANDLTRVGTTIGVDKKEMKRQGTGWDLYSSTGDLVQAMEKQRVDREKIDLVKEWLKQAPDATSMVREKVMSILVQFDHECTKFDCLETLAPHLMNLPKPTNDAIIRNFLFFKDQVAVAKLLRQPLEPSRPHPVPLAFATAQTNPQGSKSQTLHPGRTSSFNPSGKLITESVLAQDID